MIYLAPDDAEKTVDDTDAALGEIVDLGGSIPIAAEDTPYGRLATASDPNGARFKLVATE